MEYRQLGRSGLRVSQLCLGTMTFRPNREKENVAAVHEAIELGVNFIDTADCYGPSEEIVGKALAEGAQRDKVVLATKAAWQMGQGPNDYGTSRIHLLNACEDSLRKLRTDHIDLYILHVVDPNTPLEETLRTLDLLVRQGKVRYIGTSKWPPVLIVEALCVSDRLGLERFVSEQSPYNLLDRGAEDELVWTALRHGIGITAFMPLGSGLLSGKYHAGEEPPAGSRFAGRKSGEDQTFTAAVQAVERFRPIAESKGITMAQMALAWLMQQPGVTSAILGAWKAEYVRSAVEACQVTFTADELAQIDEIVPPGGRVRNYYAGNVYQPMRMGYSVAARALPDTGAYIPLNPARSGRRLYPRS